MKIWHEDISCSKPPGAGKGHVNNAVFATLRETAGVEILYDPERLLAEPGSAFVIARLALDFRGEIRWPGDVLIGTRAAAIGRSSATLQQGLFQNGHCVARGETVIVLMDEATRKSRPLTTAAIGHLSTLRTEP